MYTMISVQVEEKISRHFTIFTVGLKSKKVVKQGNAHMSKLKTTYIQEMETIESLY